MQAAAVRTSALDAITAHALAASRTATGEAALAYWCERTPNTSIVLPRETFAAEAAFAAVARAALEQRLGPRASELSSAFPHLYEARSFSWYTPPKRLHDELLDELTEHAADEPTELLGWMYQFTIPPEVRRQFGQFYTGSALVRSMLDSAHYSGPAILGHRLIDPACGTGAFLAEATRRLLVEADSANLPAEATCDAVSRAVHGMDLNALGVLLTEATLALLLTPFLLRTRPGYRLAPLKLFVTDSLEQGGLLDVGSPVSDLKLRAGVFTDGFDYVLANPPYAKFPTRMMNDQQRHRFATTLYGHPNMYGMFLQLGVELLAENGRLVFINPKSFVSGLYFRNLRRFLSEYLDILSFDTFAKRNSLFAGVLQEVVILSGRRSRSQSAFIRLREFSESPDEPASAQFMAPAASVLLAKSFDQSFCVVANPVAHRVIERMTRASKPLARFGFKVTTGTIVWNRVKQHIQDQDTRNSLPLIWGNGVQTFRFAGIGNRNGKATHCALVDRTESIITRGDALLVKRLTAREEARRIVACRLPDELAASAGYFGENHINIVRPTATCQLPLDGVLGLLNSRLFDSAFRALNGNTQVSATELEQLPIPSGAELEEIAEITRELTAHGGRSATLLEQLNRAVYELYGISDEDAATLGYAP